MTNIKIITPRLVLRPANIRDAAEVQKAKEDMWPELQAWMNWASDDQKPLAPMLDDIAANPPLTLL